MGGLRPLGAALSAPIRIHSQRFDSLSASWHRGSRRNWFSRLCRTMDPAQQEVAFLQQVADEQEAYERILLASSALKEALRAEMEAGEAEMKRVRGIQTEYTQSLVVLGLLATVVVLVLAWRLRMLMKEVGGSAPGLPPGPEGSRCHPGGHGGWCSWNGPPRSVHFLNRAGAELLGYSTRGGGEGRT